MYGLRAYVRLFLQRIAQVWPAIPGFLFIMQPEDEKHAVEPSLLCQQRAAGRGPGDGRLFRIPGQRPERAAHAPRPHVGHRRGVRLLPVPHAHAGLGVRANGGGVFFGV